MIFHVCAPYLNRKVGEFCLISWLLHLCCTTRREELGAASWQLCQSWLAVTISRNPLKWGRNGRKLHKCINVPFIIRHRDPPKYLGSGRPGPRNGKATENPLFPSRLPSLIVYHSKWPSGQTCGQAHGRRRLTLSCLADLSSTQVSNRDH